MTISEIATLVGLGVLVANAGVQWGLQIAARTQNEKDHERLEKSVSSCRADSQSAISARHDDGRERYTAVSAEVDGLGVKIDALGTKIEGVVGGLSTRVAELHAEYRVQSARIERLERHLERKTGYSPPSGMPAARDPRRDP